ncbi:MAG: hypothetical protein RTU30_06395 [Candidatus Thorarchaeota archaeon]
MNNEDPRTVALQSTVVSCYIHVYVGQNASTYYVKTYQSDAKLLETDSKKRE